MITTLAERIQILRKRAGMNQGTLGSKAFQTSFESGRTKIKNIELGKQTPCKADIERLANVLNVPVTELTIASASTAPANGSGSIHPDVLALFPGLGEYMDMLNKAVILGDDELIHYIAEKIRDVMAMALSEVPLQEHKGSRRN